jgi:hypothetical protein
VRALTCYLTRPTPHAVEILVVAHLDCRPSLARQIFFVSTICRVDTCIEVLQLLAKLSYRSLSPDKPKNVRCCIQSGVTECKQELRAWATPFKVWSKCAAIVRVQMKLKQILPRAMHVVRHAPKGG